MSFEKREKTFNIGFGTVKTSSEIIDGETLDTDVKIRTDIVIAGNTIDDFIKDFEKIIDKYRI